MKHLYFAALSILICICADVQAKPFTTGCKWSYAHWNECYGKYSFTLLELDEPYELNGKTYYKLYQTSIDVNGNKSDKKLLTGIRENEGVVYADYNEYIKDGGEWYDDIYGFSYPVTTDKEVMIYNFNLNTDDFITPEDKLLRFFVRDKKSVKVENGEERSLFEIAFKVYYTPDNIPEDFWGNVITGIGSLNTEGLLLHPFARYPYNYSNPPCEKEHFLNVYVENGKVVYKALSNLGDQDNPFLHATYQNDPFLGSFVTGISDATTENKEVEDNTFYDVSGRKIVGTPGKGLYIRNGKKVLVK